MKKISALVFICLLLVGGNEYSVLDIKKKKLMGMMYAGGKTTVFTRTSFGFENPATNLSDSNLEKHLIGDAEFEQKFIGDVNSKVNPGLGPLFNHNACIRCHPSDGRARFPKNFVGMNGILMRASIAGKNKYGGAVPVPGFGTQIQNHSASFLGMQEADYEVTFEHKTEILADGTEVNLRKPIITLKNPYRELPKDIMLSPRIEPPVFGLGLLEAIPEEDILALQDINDIDKDGISGKANYVWNPYLKKTELGRFGWKANTSNLQIQSAAAYNDDMGITSYVFPDHSCDGQPNCQQPLPDDNDNMTPKTDITDNILDNVVFYVQTIAVPAPSEHDFKKNEVVFGYDVFERIGCAKCHVPEMRTGDHPIEELSRQTIYPYTDMLLHDMGEGLADGRPDYLANGREWKTRPLWGIGLTKLANGHTDFLHDGRARNITEAIMWHSGEAEKSKLSFAKLSKKERENLLSFINAL